MDCKLEVITLPVSDPDAAKAFYSEQLDFQVDVDWAPTPAFRIIQLTPSGSAASIQLGTGITDAPPGSSKDNYLVVTDIEAAHQELNGRAVQTSNIFHKEDRQNWAGRYQPGTDPDHADYASFFTFEDPDGNSWWVQERTSS